MEPEQGSARGDQKSDLKGVASAKGAGKRLGKEMKSKSRERKL